MPGSLRTCLLGRLRNRQTVHARHGRATRGQGASGPRPLRRAALEPLESRDLLSVGARGLLASASRGIEPSWVQSASLAVDAPRAAPALTAAASRAETASASATQAAASSFTTRAYYDYWKTYQFVRNLDVTRYIRAGTDFTKADYSPEGIAKRLGKPLEQIDRVYDYDFAKLAEVERRLAGVGRATALRAIFQKVTRGARTDTEKHLKLIKFLHQASFHNGYIQPMYPDGQMVTDPLVLLELGEMRCGHVARVAVDLFAAAGYKGRLVALDAHTIAEVYYGGRWHYVDADLFGNGEVVRNPDGSIPSVAELSQNPWRIDQLAAYWEPTCNNTMQLGGSAYPSYFYFSQALWNAQQSGRAPYVVRKVASTIQSQYSRFYGWERCVVESYPGRKLYDLPLQYTPGAPQINQIDCTPADPGTLRVSLSWLPSPDADGDLAGYRVFVSRTSRGWNYDGQSLPADLMAFKSSTAGWNPSKYTARFTLPRSEVAMIQTTATSVELLFSQAGDYYITIMPYDVHGQQVGRTIFPMSEEIRIRHVVSSVASSGSATASGGAGADAAGSLASLGLSAESLQLAQQVLSVEGKPAAKAVDAIVGQVGAGGLVALS